MSEVLTTKFNKMRLESWRGGWAYKPHIQDGEQYLILEGSPAKAATGQNLYLPEMEGLARAVFRGVRPFMLELRERCGIQLGYDDFSSYFYQCLVTARVQRIDLTSMFKFPDTAQAEAFIAFLDVQRSGIYYKGDAVKRWRRESDTSLSCGSGRRWRAKFYLKQPEMTVRGHCPRLKVSPELWDEADGVGRFEWEHRSENMLDEEKAIRFWTGSRIREARLKFWSKVFIPGVPYRAAPRYRRTRKEVDLTPKMAAVKLEQFMANLSESTKTVLNERPLGVLREMFESLYVTKKHEYSFEDRYETDEREGKMRKRDFEVLKAWQNGVDVWPDISQSHRTARRIFKNIHSYAGVDIRAQKQFETPIFKPAIEIQPFVFKRNWNDLIAA